MWWLKWEPNSLRSEVRFLMGIRRRKNIFPWIVSLLIMNVLPKLLSLYIYGREPGKCIWYMKWRLASYRKSIIQGPYTFHHRKIKSMKVSLCMSLWRCPRFDIPKINLDLEKCLHMCERIWRWTPPFWILLSSLRTLLWRNRVSARIFHLAVIMDYPCKNMRNST